MINYGLVGIGGFATTWVRCLQALEGKGVAKLAAAVVRNPAKYAAQVDALRSRGCTIYATLEEMLAQGRGRLQVIGVPTGIAYHEPLGIQALSAGYNTLIEKPVTGTVQEVARLTEAQRRSGRWCAVDYQWIYSPTTAWIKAMLASGKLGALREARSVIGWPRPASYYARNVWAGQLRDNGQWILDGPATNATAHYLTNMTYLAAAQTGGMAEITSVRAELYRSKPIPSYDTSCIEVLMSSGARLVHYATHALTQPLEPVTQLLCEKGSVEWIFQNDTATIRYADGTVERFSNPDAGYNHTRPFEQVARVAAGQEESPSCTLLEGAPQVLAINLAFESCQGVIPIAAEHVYRTTAKDGSELLGITDMEGTLQRALSSGALFSEMGLPWSRPTAAVHARGYSSFPQDAKLRGWLAQAT